MCTGLCKLLVIRVVIQKRVYMREDSCPEKLKVYMTSCWMMWGKENKG